MQIIGSRLRTDLPTIRVRWLRGYDKVDWSKALIFLALGKKGSGKSALLENIGLRYPRIVDLFGSRDDEGLCWCRDISPIDDVLLIHGDNVDINCSWDTCKIGELTYDKMMQYEVSIPSYSFFTSDLSRFVGISQIMKLFWDRKEWKSPVYVTVREASSFIYSRIKQDNMNMKNAKADFIFWQREMRHFGYALGIDTIRWTSIDKEMRDLADYQIIKKVGGQGLPDDISFLYKYIDPMSMARLRPDKFLIFTDNASIGLGYSDYPEFHKEEGVDIVKELGITFEYSEEPEESTVQKVGDSEHAIIIKLYQSGLSMKNVSLHKDVKRSDATVHKHISDHDKEVEENGLCHRCKRANSDLYDVIVSRSYY